MSDQDNRDDALTGWDAGKAEAKKRFGKKPNADSVTVQNGRSTDAETHME